jgi:hypothetical protein
LLLVEIKRTLGSFMGVSITGFSSLPAHSAPLASGMMAAAVYALIPILEMLFPAARPQLVILSW